MRGCDRKRFLAYCLYAFGVPLLMTSIILIIDNIELIDKRFQVGMGEESCWFKYQNHSLSELIYLYSPLSVILVFNLSFYSVTAYKIYSVQKETSMVRDVNSKKHSMENEQNRLVTFSE